MNETLDLYLRAHTVVLDQENTRPQRKTTTALSKLPKWADYALVFACESRTGITQELTFGFYRVLKFNGDTYTLVEEGGFFDDNLPVEEREILKHISTLQCQTRPRFHPTSRSFRALISSEAFSTGMRVEVLLWSASTYAMRLGDWPGDGHPASRTNGRSCCLSTPMETKTCT